MGHTSSVSVFYCDYGYYSSLNVNQLFPLRPLFADFPVQSIKAKLAGKDDELDRFIRMSKINLIME